MKDFIRFLVAIGIHLALLGSPGFDARATLITDSTTFSAFSITYNQSVWGSVKFPFEADSFTQNFPVSQFGFGRFFFDPGFRVSSNGSSGPPNLAILGQITFSAKPGWGLYDLNFIQSGQWTTTGAGLVSVDGSFIDVTATNAQFFFTDHRAFVNPISQTPAGNNGYYYVIGERSSLSRFDRLTLDYDIQLSATSASGPGFASLFSDISDPSFLFNAGPYPDSNIVGTFLSLSFERVATTPEPNTYALVLVGFGVLYMYRRYYRRDK